ncbi:MAG TPA: GTP 3',8-cyclase MoaA [Planctomycetota bacterium]|nr:GTP 3',8-cyclase MoaA [Planctomycetota bacterium]
MRDSFGRAFTYLRVSVTDRCNLLCSYCRAADTPRPERLRAEELLRIVHVAASLGVRKVRLTGGEPTLRADLVDLTRAVAATPGIREVVMTTNGLRLCELARPLRDAGLSRVNVSCDSLDDVRFRSITGGGVLRKVLDGIDASLDAGLRVKVNCVVLGGVNDAEAPDLVRYAHERGIEIRFIEYMPMDPGDIDFLGGSSKTVPSAVLRARIEETFDLEPERSSDTAGPAETWRIAGTETRVGFVSAMSNPFCESCNRLRITPEGKIRSCLLTGGEVDLVEAMRAGATDGELADCFRLALERKPPVYELHRNGAVAMRAIGG